MDFRERTVVGKNELCIKYKFERDIPMAITYKTLISILCGIGFEFHSKTRVYCQSLAHKTQHTMYNILHWYNLIQLNILKKIWFQYNFEKWNIGTDDRIVISFNLIVYVDLRINIFTCNINSPLYPVYLLYIIYK